MDLRHGTVGAWHGTVGAWHGTVGPWNSIGWALAIPIAPVGSTPLPYPGYTPPGITHVAVHGSTAQDGLLNA